MNGIKCYVAGAYSSDPLPNVEAAINAADKLLRLGYVPFVPHLTHFWDEQHAHDYAVWLEWCLEWVKVCDAVLRLPGESHGADVECELAYGIDIPVFHSIEDLHASFTEQL